MPLAQQLHDEALVASCVRDPHRVTVFIGGVAYMLLGLWPRHDGGA